MGAYEVDAAIPTAVTLRLSIIGSNPTITSIILLLVALLLALTMFLFLKGASTFGHFDKPFVDLRIGRNRML